MSGSLKTIQTEYENTVVAFLRGNILEPMVPERLTCCQARKARERADERVPEDDRKPYWTKRRDIWDAIAKRIEKDNRAGDKPPPQQGTSS